MYILYLIIFVLMLISFIKDKQRTLKVLKMAYKKFIKIAFPFFLMILLVSIALSFFSEDRIINLLQNSSVWLNSLIASLIGSIFLMPGFIAYPLCSVLYQNGLPMMVVTAFVTTLMMVGILTFPIEKKYLGTKVAIIRIVMSLLISFLITIIIGLLWGEII
ncbi:MAG: permease [Candidatus Cloacimonetes bacterium]|nr:permease [Candidatus Cloacimonadota bacterium]